MSERSNASLGEMPDRLLADKPAHHRSPTKAVRFRYVDTWIFDLDNTLYPPHADLWPKVDQKITAFVADFHGIDGLSARALQKYYYQTHGTTLNGLMNEHALDPAPFLAFVHDIDRSNLALDHQLAGGIAGLPGRKLVFTNGSRRHAEETMRALGIDHLFDDIFDIVASEFVPKPARRPYERFLATHGVDPGTAAMFEDIPRNLDVPRELGMATVLVVPDARGDHKEAWERGSAAGANGAFDAVTDDLPAFVETLARQLRPPEA